MKYRTKSAEPLKKKKVKKPEVAVEPPASVVDDDVIEDNHVLMVEELPPVTTTSVSQRAMPVSAFPDIQPWFVPAGEWASVIATIGDHVCSVELDFGAFLWAWSLIEQRARVLQNYAIRPGISDEFWESTSSVTMRAMDAFRAEAAKSPALHRPVPEAGKKPVVAMPKEKPAKPVKKTAKKTGRRKYKTKA